MTGLTVSSLSFGESDSRKLVTWKDTIKSSKSENIPVVSKSKNVVETPSGRNRNGCDKDVQLETFSNLANQSKSRKGDNCTFKVVVKEKKSEELDDNKKKQQESVGVKRIKSPDRKIKGDRPVSSRLSTSRLTPKKNERDASNNILQNPTVHRQIRNPHIKRRLPAGTNSSKLHSSKDKSLISKENFTGFILDQENEDITIKIDICNNLTNLPTMQIEDLDNNVFLDEHTEDAGIVSDSLDTEDSVLVKEEEIVFTNSRDIVLYDEEFNPGSDANIYDTEYYKNQLSALKTQLSSIENNVRMNWRDDFLEGEAYEETISRRSSPRDKLSKFRSDRSSRRGSASKSGNRSPRIRTPRCGNSPESKYSDHPRKSKSRSSSLKKSADKRSLRSSSDVMLDKKESSRSKIPLSKHLKSPKSLNTTPRIRLKQPTAPILTEKCNTTILSARGDKMLTMIDSTSRCISPTGSPHRKHLSKSRHASPRERKSENKITSKADQSPIQETARRIKKIKRAKSNINSKESSPRSGAVVTSSKFNEDNIVTQYQRCKALCQDKKIEKVNSGDVGVSCLTRFRRDSKIVNCQRFLERNKLVEVDLKSPASSSDDTDTYCFPDKLAMDVCCQTSSIEGIATTIANKEELQNGEKNRRMVDDEMSRMVERNNGKDRKKKAYFDSLDGSSSESINSDVFKGKLFAQTILVNSFM